MSDNNLFSIRKISLTIFTIMIFSLIGSNSVFAYSVDQSSGTIPSHVTQSQSTQLPPIDLNWIGNSISSISRWWQDSSGQITSFITNSFSSMRQVNTQVSQITVGNTNIGRIYQNLDSWLYSVVGFHITGIWTALISLIGWLLNLAKEIILWALSLIH